MEHRFGFRLVDAHHHLWEVGRSDLPWITPAIQSLARTFSTTDLAGVFDGSGVERGVLVQSGMSDADNALIDEWSRETDHIAGVVAWADIAGNRLDGQLDALCRNPKVVGIRLQAEDSPDDGLFDHPEVVRGLRRLADRGLTYDFLVRVPQLRSVPKVYGQVPNLKGVIDHMAKPDIANGQGLKEWEDALRAAAAVPGLHCKLSGQLALAGPNPTAEKLKPYVQLAIEIFGVDRVMWGSDWPVATLAADYATTLTTMREAMGDLSSADEEKIFRTNAMRFYGLS